MTDQPQYPRLENGRVWVVEEDKEERGNKGYPSYETLYRKNGKLALSIVEKKTELTEIRTNPRSDKTSVAFGHIGEAGTVTTDANFMGKPRAWTTIKHITNVLMTQQKIEPTVRSLEEAAARLKSRLDVEENRRSLLGEFSGRLQDAVE